MKKMRKMIIEDFVEELASKAPTPGGGAVAALCSSLAVALGAMVFNLSIDKKFYNEYDTSVKNKMQDLLKNCNSLKEEFLVLMEEDKNAFNKVMDAYKLPRESEEEKTNRANRILEGCIFAMEVPLEVAKKTLEIFEYLEFSVEYGNPNVVSDAGVGAICALAAIESSILNVKINLSNINNTELVTSTNKLCENLMNLGNEKKKHIMNLVYDKI